MTGSYTNEPLLRVLDIIPGTSVDGPGLRTSIYFAGCAHGCPGCHNPQSWNFDGGEVMSVTSIMDVIRENEFNVTFSGGDPIYQAEALLPLARAIKEEGYNIWCYTGFTIEQLMDTDFIASNPVVGRLLDYIDVLVDGPFIESLRDLSLLFRGSSNQRIIYLHEIR